MWYCNNRTHIICFYSVIVYSSHSLPNGKEDAYRTRSLSSAVTGHVYVSRHLLFVGARRWLSLCGLTLFPNARHLYDTRHVQDA